MNENENQQRGSTQRRESVNSKMELWEAVCRTHPDVTKAVGMRGGFTAVCPQSQIKKATEVLGVCGIGWGVDFEAEEYVRDDANRIIEYVYRGSLWFIHCDNTGRVSCCASMKYKAGDDVQMKCETHARSKALSKLGFNSDVFEGRFDDLAYVEETRRELNGVVNPPEGTPPDVQVTPTEIDDHSSALEHLRECFRQKQLPSEKVNMHLAQWCDDYGVPEISQLTAKQINECAFELEQTYNKGSK